MGMAGQTGMQIVGVLFIIIWTTACSVLMFGLLRVARVLRVKTDVEIHGLDMDHHLGYTGILRLEEEEQSTVEGLDLEESRDGSVTPHVEEQDDGKKAAISG